MLGYLVYVIVTALINPDKAPPATDLGELSRIELAKSLAPPIGLIFLVLGSIITGVATPTEAAGVGALGALLLSLAKGRMNLARLQDSLLKTVETTTMIFMILIGASLFSLVFRGFGGGGINPFHVPEYARWRCDRGNYRDAGDFPAWLYPRLYRNHLCGCAYHRPRSTHDGFGPYLARHHDRHQSADLLSHPTLWLCPVLSAWSLRRRDQDKRYIPRRDTLYCHPVGRASCAGDLAKPGYMAPLYH